jgi:hypothetical protein
MFYFEGVFWQFGVPITAEEGPPLPRHPAAAATASDMVPAYLEHRLPRGA